MVCPVIPVPCVAKNVTVDATWSAVTVPKGARKRISSCMRSKLAIPPLAAKVVAMPPALTALTRVLWGASSTSPVQHSLILSRVVCSCLSHLCVLACVLEVGNGDLAVPVRILFRVSRVPCSSIVHSRSFLIPCRSLCPARMLSLVCWIGTEFIIDPIQLLPKFLPFSPGACSCSPLMLPDSQLSYS